jgi:hypothetical protein
MRTAQRVERPFGIGKARRRLQHRAPPSRRDAARLYRPAGGLVENAGLSAAAAVLATRSLRLPQGKLLVSGHVGSESTSPHNNYTEVSQD